MKKILRSITILWSVLGVRSNKQSENAPSSLDLKATTNIESKRLSNTTHDLRESTTGFPSGIFKQTTGSTNTTSTIIAPQPSLTMMVCSTAIMSLVGIMVLLCQLSIMAILLLKSWPVLLLSVIVINSIITIRLMLALRRLMVLWWDASRAKKRLGQGKLMQSGGRVW